MPSPATLAAASRVDVRARIPTPEPTEVHVWRASLDPGGERVQELGHIVSLEERERVDRLRSGRARRRLTLSRGILRELLARYTGIAPERLSFHHGAGGKPSLSGEAARSRLRFNLSHSEELLLVAIARGGLVGIDVEAIRPVPGAESLARRFFSAREQTAIRRAPEPERTSAFLTCWTRKEACVKATGDGVWAAARRFEVTVAPDERTRVVAVDGDPKEASRWSLFPLEPAEGYVGALAVRGRVRRIEAWELDSRGAARRIGTA
ncbi:MAG: 4'-phosphopantetheinyl transferase family protein [Gemmatimonadota bacterium]